MSAGRIQILPQALPTRWLGRGAVVLDAVDSTNRWMKERWIQGECRHGAVVWADQQTAGRGRLGRTWDSPAGKNIYTSVLLEPPKARLTGILSLMAGVAAVQAVHHLTGLDARMKWPNDGVIGGKKFCGVLVEAGTEPSPWAIVGIGINVLGRPDAQFPHATSLAEAGATVPREGLWTALMVELEAQYEAWLSHGDSWVVSQWRAKNATLGYRVQVVRPHETPWIGVAQDIDATGSLVVLRDGERVTVTAGEVQVRLADGRYAPGS